jgi:hypothetical protein
MPFVFLIVGLMILVIGVRGQSNTAIKLLQSEFTGANSFIQWFLAIMILGLVGYYKPIKPLSDGLIGLVILAMILNEQSQNNIFGALEQAFQNTTPSAPSNDPFAPSTPNANAMVQSINQMQAGVNTGTMFPTSSNPATSTNISIVPLG